MKCVKSWLNKVHSHTIDLLCLHQEHFTTIQWRRNQALCGSINRRPLRSWGTEQLLSLVSRQLFTKHYLVCNNVQNASKLLVAGALTQSPPEEFTALLRPIAGDQGFTALPQNCTVVLSPLALSFGP